MPSLPFADAIALLDALEVARGNHQLDRQAPAGQLAIQARQLCQKHDLHLDDVVVNEAIAQFQSVRPDPKPLSAHHTEINQTNWKRPVNAMMLQAARQKLIDLERRWRQKTRWAVVIIVLLTFGGTFLMVSLPRPWWGLALVGITQLGMLFFLNRFSGWFDRPARWRERYLALEPLSNPLLRAIRWWGVPSVVDQARRWLETDVPLLVGDGIELDARAETERGRLRVRLRHRLLHTVLSWPFWR